jgi:tripartite-type tricarboxylate transporter receptor subunit TctC
MRRFLVVRTLSLGALALALCAQAATAQSVEQFYKGRNINLLVASAPGGVNDLVGRLIARHLGDFSTGKPSIVVQNLHAAGIVLANRLALSRRV